MTAFKLVPELAVILAYVERVAKRPAVVRATAKEAEHVAEQAQENAGIS